MYIKKYDMTLEEMKTELELLRGQYDNDCPAIRRIEKILREAARCSENG